MELILLLVLVFIYLLSLMLGFMKRRQVSLYVSYAGFFLHLAILIIRAITAKHPPFTNVYESLLLLSWLMQVKFLFFQRATSARVVHLQRLLLVVFISVLIFLPPGTREIRPVMPALNSVWMYIHVPSYLFGYVSLFSGLILAIIRLFSRKNIFPYDEQMDTDISLAMIFMSAGMVTGAIWGQISWGNFWSWDPKETWALINIILLSLYFHKSDRKTQSLIVILATLSVLFTYFGVTWLLSGLHSYS
ncbi:MAG: cytochrome c biogenesis protein CcsA [Candidatus Marinimicrobia bacterium]|nr:cytochrome c biogenesis protein CcsA [Candidatus Neomarinimicrobiota bacterium]